jgi:hypothetical protein
MGNRNQEPSTTESVEDLFEPAFADLPEEVVLLEMEPISSEKHRLVQKRRMAERKLEEKRLRDELGDYDLEF